MAKVNITKGSHLKMALEFPAGSVLHAVTGQICLRTNGHVIVFDTDEVMVRDVNACDLGLFYPAQKNTCHHWAFIDGLKVVDVFAKDLDTVIQEDRKNHEGYVLSWPVPGQTPLKIKVKHESFLDLQKVVHAATPKAILDALQSGNVSVLDTWLGQTDEPIGRWVKEWVEKFNGKYGDILVKSNSEYTKARFLSKERKEFAAYLHKFVPAYAAVCFAMLDDKNHKPIIWKLVEKHFEAELGKLFTVEMKPE